MNHYYMMTISLRQHHHWLLYSIITISLLLAIGISFPSMDRGEWPYSGSTISGSCALPASQNLTRWVERPVACGRYALKHMDGTRHQGSLGWADVKHCLAGLGRSYLFWWQWERRSNSTWCNRAIDVGACEFLTLPTAPLAQFSIVLLAETILNVL